MDDKDAKQFYNSSAWIKKREEILIRDHYECQDCRKRIQENKESDLHGWQRRIQKARQVHHIIELKERPDLALDDSNLISLCVMCHNIRHGREPFAFKAKEKKKKVTNEMW